MKKSRERLRERSLDKYLKTYAENHITTDAWGDVLISMARPERLKKAHERALKAVIEQIEDEC